MLNPRCEPVPNNSGVSVKKFEDLGKDTIESNNEEYYVLWDLARFYLHSYIAENRDLYYSKQWSFGSDYPSHRLLGKCYRKMEGT